MLKFKFAMIVNIIMISELPWLQRLIVNQKSKLVYVRNLMKDLLRFGKYTLCIYYVTNIITSVHIHVPVYT